MMELSVGCFNLVIEGLLVSSAEDAKKYVHDKLKFQSRNRGAFGFKVGQIAGILEAAVFQSRNRDAFGFKLTLRMPTSNSKKSFNLVIEMLLVSRFLSTRVRRVKFLASFNLGIEVLLVSRTRQCLMRLLPHGFQSRNRGTFGFKNA